MALFKIFKGSSTALGATSATSAANEGFAYFTPDNGKFYIDIADATTATVGVNRIPLNAYQADLATTSLYANHAASSTWSRYAASAGFTQFASSANWANYAGTANQAVKVYQTASNSTTADYRILLSTSAVDTAETGSLNKSTNLRYNPSTNKLLTVNIDLTGELNVTGNTNLHNQTTIDNATLGTLLVNGAATFNQIPQSVTPADASNDTSVATTAFVYNAFKANDAMLFKGVVNQDSDLPATHYKGWTYRVGTKGYYAGEYCELGDIIICVTNGTSANALHWARIQNNVDGAVYMGFGANAAADIGSTTQPVYVQSNGKVSAVSYVASAARATYAASAGYAQLALTASYAVTALRAISAASANYATSAAMATQAGKLTNLTSTDNASATDTWRKVWISYNDNATGRPAITDNLVFQTSTNTLKTVNTTLTGNLDVTGNAYLHNQSYIDNAQVGNLIVTGPTALNNTLSVGDRASFAKCINNLLTGTGTAGRDAGAGASPRYFPAIWTFDAGFAPQNGDIFAIKIPVAGHSYGVFLSVDGGVNYYPIVCNGTGRLTTHYGVNTQILLMFDSAGSAASMTPKDGAAAANGSTISGGVFRVLNYYDANTTYSAMSVAEARNGTATTSRTMRADYLKTFLSTLGGTGLTFTHNSSGIVLNHSNSITAKTAYGSTTTTASANGGTIKVTDIQYDAQGHITASTDRTITLSQNDTKNTAGSTNTTSKIFLIGATSQAANPQTYSHSAVYVTNGTLTAGTFSGSGASLTSLNGSNISSGTVPFARLPSIYWANLAGTSAASYGKAPEMAKIKLNGNTSASSASTKNVELVYNSTTEVLNFVFS